jgi:acetyl-CoA carboxylase carboxyl transferase subunit alpha
MTKRHFLDFEQPVAELEAKIEELRYVQNESAVDISEEIDRLSKKSLLLTKDIYSGLTPWQVTQIARHPQRPYTLDYDRRDLHRLSRSCTATARSADDQSIVGGLARFNGQACVVFGHQKGARHEGACARNFGMSRPGGLPQGAQADEVAEKFGLPVFSFVDTPGAYPGHRRRGARPVGGDRPQHLRDGEARGADRRHDHRRGRLGRSARDQRRRPAPACCSTRSTR